jgi:hypothetical protein
MKYFGWGMLILIGLFIGGAILKTCSTASKYIDNGVNTAYEEFKPEELLRKYEWFKDASSQCEQKLATLKTYESRFKSIKQSYGADSLKRKNWARTDIEQWNVWESEYLGMKASYNDLSAQYNGAMAKFNFRFCNVGGLPGGADQPLPREFKPYLTN